MRKINWEKGLFRIYIIPTLCGLVYFAIAAHMFIQWNPFFFGCLAEGTPCINIPIDPLFKKSLEMFSILSLLPWGLHFTVKKILFPLIRGIFKWFISGFNDNSNNEAGK